MGMATPDQPSPAISSLPAQATSSSRPRVLACVLCQQRKVKCDRKFPCANCVRACANCVPASLNVRQRRRRFPERLLLERLRHYESLLHQNNIQFEPLHPPSEDGRGSDSPDEQPSKEKTTVKSETVYGAKLRFPREYTLYTST